MLVFGGGGQDDSKAQGSLLCLDLKTDRWSTIETRGARPNGIGKPGMVYVEREDALYVFGGWAEGADKPTAELWTLPLGADGKLGWRRILEDGDRPPARNGCCLVVDAKRNRLFLHGGDGGPHPEYGFTPLDDLWEFNLAKRRWRKLEPTGTVPEPRWSHAFAVDQERGVMYILGGSGYVGDRPVTDRDIFALHLESLKWTKLSARKAKPRATLGATLTYDSDLNFLLVVGGLSFATKGPAGPRSLWTFDPETRTWTWQEEMLSTTRRDHVGVYDPIKKRHVIFGGRTAAELGNHYAKGKPLANVLMIVAEKR